MRGLHDDPRRQHGNGGRPRQGTVRGNRVAEKRLQSLEHAAIGSVGNERLTRKSTAPGIRFDRVDAAFGGTLADARIGRLQASDARIAEGSAERCVHAVESDAGSGAFSSQAFVANGAYRGMFEGLQPFLGNAIPAHGALAGPAAVAVLPSGIVVQASHLAMRDATLRGIPISDAS